ARAVELSGSILMPLTVTSGGRSYRITGDLDAFLVSAPSGASVKHASLDDQSGAFYTFSLRVGVYQIALSNVQVFVDGNQAVDFTTTSPLTQVVNVAANQSSSIAFSFNVAGTVVHFDACSPDPNAVACATGDADHDGVSNGIECATPASACVDSDSDGTPDALDPDSDNDGVLDGADSARTDPCLPNLYAASCTDAATGTVNVNVTVTESCDAAPGDSCTFGGDAGVITTPPPGTQPPAHAPDQPDVSASSIVFSEGSGPVAESYLTSSSAPTGAFASYFPGTVSTQYVPGPGSLPVSYSTSVIVESSSVGKLLLSPTPGGGGTTGVFSQNTYVMFQLASANGATGWAWITMTVNSNDLTRPQPVARRTIAVQLQ
ncbi:MAG: hypothetical protein JWN04_3602, partial [Myxococcaceae bacterium]|nr:hypothetical protein [Myxococcaceae bacterium]